MHPAAATTQRSTWQPHHIVRRIAAADEPDFIELGPFTCGDVALSSRQHQVMAMFAFGFQSDRIVADYLGIKTKYVQAIVAELKKKYGWQNRREMGRAYQTMRKSVKPEGVKPMKPVMNPVGGNGHTAVTEQPPTKPKPPVATSNFDPARFYPAHVIEAADAEMEKNPRSCRCGKVFTAEVVAVWLDWLDKGKSALWIAENNGLMPTSHPTVRSYIARYRAEANRLRGEVATESEAAAPKPATSDQVPNSAEWMDSLAQAIAAVIAGQELSFAGQTQRNNNGLRICVEIKFKSSETNGDETSS